MNADARIVIVDFFKSTSPKTMRLGVAEVLGRSGPTRHDPAPTGEDGGDRASAISLAAAKRALNRREFEAAEDLLRLADRNRTGDAEVNTLRSTLYRLRQQENGPFRVLRRLL